MHKDTLLVDVDGVVANFTQGVLNMLQKYSYEPVTVTEDNIVTWDITQSLPPELAGLIPQVYATSGLAASLPTYPGMVHLIHWAAEVYNIVFVTAPMKSNPTWVYEREQWLARVFGAIPYRVVYTTSKELVRGDVFIDDKPENVEAWARVNSITEAFLMARPYNNNAKYENPAYGDMWRVDARKLGDLLADRL